MNDWWIFKVLWLTWSDLLWFYLRDFWFFSRREIGYSRHLEISPKILPSEADPYILAYILLILELNLLETIILWLIGCVAMLQLASGDSCEYFLFKLLNYSLIEWLHCNFSASQYSEECDANIFVSRAQLRWLLCKIFFFFLRLFFASLMTNA